MSASARVHIILFCLLMVSCNANNLPQYDVLASLRVLALQADKPEAHPGDTITITPYVSDVNGAGRPLQFAAEACVDPGTAYGADPTCDGNPSRTVIQSSTTAAAPAGQAATGATTTFSVSLPSGILTGRSAQDSFNGVAYLVLYTLTAGSESVHSFKRILAVSPSKTALNTNPGVGSDILFNGTASAAVNTLPSGDQTLQLSFSISDQESYQVQRADGSLRTLSEQLLTTWLISDGTIKIYRTIADGKTTWSPPTAEPTSRKSVVVAVTRDGRGGVSFLKKEF